SGTFRSAHQPETHLRAGDVFLLFPGEWHTYCPDPDKGWKCYWIGFKGRNMDERMKANFLSIEKPVYHIGFSEEFIHVFDKAIEIAEAEAIYSQQTLAGSVNYLIGMMYSLERTYQLNKNKGKADLIHRARLRIRNSVEDDVTIQQIAEETGMSYSNFRKLFKEYTGISPALYQQDLKIQRAKNLLSSTTNSIKEIAYKLHFESPDYFSARFRAKTGMRPSTFRTEHGACVPEQQQGNIL
ncbi:MAG: helix-turn-helix transcriptional regulator, partial [Prevotellaceae bacterium]|nr:helix-turn-helix transcriptional regulator [Prevotellaceae bacterium]